MISATATTTVTVSVSRLIWSMERLLREWEQDDVGARQQVDYEGEELCVELYRDTEKNRHTNQHALPITMLEMMRTETVERQHEIESLFGISTFVVVYTTKESGFSDDMARILVSSMCIAAHNASWYCIVTIVFVTSLYSNFVAVPFQCLRELV